MIEIDKLPEEIRESVKNDIQNYGESATEYFLYMAPFGRMLKDLESSHTDFVWFTITLHIINLSGSKDPSPIHFTIARDCLKKLGIDDDKSVDILAREMVKECRNFRDIIFKIFSVKDMSISINNEVLKLSDEKSFYIPAENTFPEFSCSQNECNSIDLYFSEFLETIGKNGKNDAELIRTTAPARYKQYKESDYSAEHRQEAWSVWIPKDKRSLFSPFLIVLANVLWNDKCKQRWEREKKNVPALPQGVLFHTIKPPLSKGTSIEIVNDDSIICYGENGKIVSRVPCVDPKLVNIICKGFQCLSTLNGHKLIRWQVKTGFNNWINCAEDPRLICTSGGYEGIAHLIKSNTSNKSITEVKAMLHAQAFGQFEFPQGGAGNMIIFREMEKHRNGEPSKINIILGEILLPNCTHILPKGEKRRLVPITDLPPLIGSNNTHAAQAMLQLLILEEFANQSDRLATSGSILLPKEKLEELAFQAKLPKVSLEKVITGWTQDDLFYKAFLQQYGDEYTLSNEYSNVIHFLEYQGRQRIAGSKGGEIAAAKKRDLIDRKYRKQKKLKS